MQVSDTICFPMGKTGLTTLTSGAVKCPCLELPPAQSKPWCLPSMTQGNAEDQGMTVTGGRYCTRHPIPYSEKMEGVSVMDCTKNLFLLEYQNRGLKWSKNLCNFSPQLT